MDWQKAVKWQTTCFTGSGEKKPGSTCRRTHSPPVAGTRPVARIQSLHLTPRAVRFFWKPVTFQGIELWRLNKVYIKLSNLSATLNHRDQVCRLLRNWIETCLADQMKRSRDQQVDVIGWIIISRLAPVIKWRKCDWFNLIQSLIRFAGKTLIRERKWV